MLAHGGVETASVGEGPRRRGKTLSWHAPRQPICWSLAATSLSDLGEHFGGGLYEAEVEYLHRGEWVTCAEDVLWRRSKLGPHLDDAAKSRLTDWLAGAGRAAATF